MDMRRHDREITDPAKIDEIIRACHCCRLGFADAGEVYIVPLNFGFTSEGGKRTFYFHGATEGRKIGLIRQSPRVAFELDTHYRLNEAETACGYSARFQSVMGTGIVHLLEDHAEKAEALRHIMQHNTGKADWTFPEAMLTGTAVFRCEVETISCKEHE